MERISAEKSESYVDIPCCTDTKLIDADFCKVRIDNYSNLTIQLLWTGRKNCQKFKRTLTSYLLLRLFQKTNKNYTNTTLQTKKEPLLT